MPGADVRAELRVLVLEQHVAGPELLVLEDVGDRVDRPADHAGLVEHRSISAAVVAAGPLGDDALDLLLVLAAREVGREPRRLRELRPAHRLAEAAEDLVGVRGDHDPLAVARLEDVRGRDALQPGPAGAADDPEPVVLGNHALEQREAGLHQRDVDHLAAAAAERVAPVERGEDALRREHPGERVAERDVDPRRRLVREAVDVADAAHRLRHRGEAGARRVRPGLPVAGDARDHQPGIRLPQTLRRRGSSARACRAGSSRPGRRTARPARAAAPGPRSSRRLSVTHFLFRDCTGHQSERPS